MPLQEGIYFQPGQKPARCLSMMFLRAQAGATAAAIDGCLAGLFAVYDGLRAGHIDDLPGVDLPPGDLTILIGFGPKAFSISGARRALPQDLGPQHNFRGPDAAGGGRLLAGSGLTYASGVARNPATEEFVVQAIAETPLAANRAIVETQRYLEEHLDPATGTQTIQLACAFTGFNREDGRSWINFHDGLSNLTSGQDRQDAIEVKPQGVAADQWTEGGTYMTFMRLAVDLRAWRKLSQPQQELIVGRSKISGCALIGVDGAGLPLPIPACPFAGTHSVLEPGNDAFRDAPGNVDPIALESHIQRANHHLGPIDRPVSRRIYRQGYEFLEPPQPGLALVAGLNFVSFQDALERIFFVLTTQGWLGSTNFGGAPGAGLVDSLLSVYAAGVFFCPPVTAGEAYPGQSVFA